MTQMEKLQETYNLERKQLMQQCNVLQQEIDTMQREFNKQSKISKKVEELNRTITALQKDKILVVYSNQEIQTYVYYKRYFKKYLCPFIILLINSCSQLI